jgi:hypothetical protein
VKPES